MISKIINQFSIRGFILNLPKNGCATAVIQLPIKMSSDNF